MLKNCLLGSANRAVAPLGMEKERVMMPSSVARALSSPSWTAAAAVAYGDVAPAPYTCRMVNILDQSSLE